MSKPVAGALEQALACMAAPGLLPGARASRLPDDVLVVLRLAADDQACLAEHAARLGLPARKLHDAAVFYIQQVLFAQGADSYRVLGSNADAPDSRLREHYRWLVRWLHPDRNSNEWEDVYLDRVHRAWQQLRNPERRRVHDLAAAHMPPSAAPVARSESISRRAAVAVLPPARSASPRVFPILGLGAALAAVAALFANFPLALDEVDGSVQMPAAAPAERQLALLPVHNAEPAPPEVPADVDQAVAEDDIATMPVVGDAPTPVPLASAHALPVMSTTPSPVAAGKSDPIALAPAKELPAPPRQAPDAAVVAAANPSKTEIRAVAPGVPAISTKIAASAPSAKETLEQRGVVTPATKAMTVATMSPLAQPSLVDRPAPVSVTANPAPVVSEKALASGSRLSINDRVAFGLVQKFRRAYNEGNLEQVMALFAREARHPDGGGREAIIESFRREFESRARARITVGRPDWRVEDQHAVVVAGYRAQRAGMSGPDGQESSGSIRFELRQEDGELRIAQVQPNRF